MANDETLKRAREYVMWLLARRDYSRVQLERKLRARDLEKPEIATLLQQLIDDGYYNVSSFQKVRTRQLLKRGLGAAVVKSKLRSERCEVKDSDIATAYREIGSDPETELRTLIQKHLRRFARQETLDKKELTMKITKSLQLKGHRFADISKILAEELRRI